MQELEISAIRQDGGTQTRATINELVVDEYTDAMKAGAVFPPLVVFYDGDEYWLADGFHRLCSAVKNGAVSALVDVHQGTRRDAVLFSVGANARHGLRRTNEDKRRAVLALLNDAEWGLWSDREIARRCGVHHQMVARFRPVASLDESSSERQYVTKYGTPTSMNIRNIGNASVIPSPIRDAIRYTSFADNPAELRKLETLAPPRQAEIARAIADGKAETVQAAQRVIKEEKRELRREENRGLVDGAPPLIHMAGGRYQTIVIDPPWDWGDEGDDDQFGRARPTYATMPFEEIQALPVGSLACDDAHLYLWITNRSLPKGFALLQAWGFRYITCLTWCKPVFGQGNYYRGMTEQVLFGVKGSLPLLRNDVGTWFAAPRSQEHSTKPEAFYSMVELCSPGPWLELFARSGRNGWVAWGAEA